MKPSKDEIGRFAMRILYAGLIVDVGGAVVLFFLGMILENKGVVATIPAENVSLLGYVLLGVSVIELLVAIVLKKKWLNPENLARLPAKNFKILSGRIFTFYMILFMVALSPAIYGFLFYVLSGMQDMFTMMACLTLIGYMMTRPRPDFIERLVEPFEFETN